LETGKQCIYLTLYKVKSTSVKLDTSGRLTNTGVRSFLPTFVISTVASCTFYYLRWLRDFGGKIYTIEIPENTRNTFQILGRSSVNTPLMNSESKDLDLRKVWAAMSCYRFFCLFLTRKQLFGIQQTKEPKHMHLGWSEYHLYWPFSLPQGDVERPHFEAVTTLSDSQAIRSVDFHPNGKLYAVGSNSKTFRICQYPQLSKLR